MTGQLITRLAAIQAAEGLSDRAFADKLGLSNGQWSGVKAGNKEMGRKTLRAIKNMYPGLTDLVDDYWLSRLDAQQATSAVA